MLTHLGVPPWSAGGVKKRSTQADPRAFCGQGRNNNTKHEASSSAPAVCILSARFLSSCLRKVAKSPSLRAFMLP